MALDLSSFSEKYPDLLLTALSREGGVTAYQLRLPSFQDGREFKWAELRLPKGFPEYGKAFIQLSPDAVLRIPHLDRDGVLCIEGDPGPGLGYSSEDRIQIVLHGYFEQFLKPWLNGDLDDNFENEALNYWAIAVARARSNTDAVRGVWTIDSPPKKARVRSGLLLIPNRIIIAADEQFRITNRLVQSMGAAAKQRVRVLVADIPISHAFTPSTWPRSMYDLERILQGRLPSEEYSRLQYSRSRRGRGIHRVVLLRNSKVSFSYLLPGGPPTVLDVYRGKKASPSLPKPLPMRRQLLWPLGDN